MNNNIHIQLQANQLKQLNNSHSFQAILALNHF